MQDLVDTVLVRTSESIPYSAVLGSCPVLGAVVASMVARVVAVVLCRLAARVLFRKICINYNLDNTYQFRARSLDLSLELLV